MSQRTPALLYKYRAINPRTVNILASQKLYFASPWTLNDPLDCAPSLDVDISARELDDLHHHLRKLLRAPPPPKEGERRRITLTKRFHPDGEDERPEHVQRQEHIKSISDSILGLLREQFGLPGARSSGILSLSSRWDCPLMWSHYAGEHTGICIGFKTDAISTVSVRPVNYTSQRSIRVSEIMDTSLGASTSERASFALATLEDRLFFTKAPTWRYEREWRGVLPQTGEFELGTGIVEILFGMRCPSAFVDRVAQVASRLFPKVRMYKVESVDNAFALKRSRHKPYYAGLFFPSSFRYERLEEATDSALKALESSVHVQ